MLDQTVRFAGSRYRVSLAVLSPKPLPAEMPHGVERVFWLPMPNLLEAAWNILSRPRHTLQEALFMSRRARAGLAAALQEVDPAVIIFDMLRTAQYAEDPSLLPRGSRRILDLDDVLSDRYSQMRRNGADELLGAMAGAMPAAARSAAAVLPRLLLSVEERRMRRREETVPWLFDAVVLTSPLEARKLARRINHPAIAACPPAVTVRPFRERGWSSGDDSTLRFVFIGPDAYGPNAEALKAMDVVAAAVTARGVPARFEAAGSISGRLELSNVRQVGFVHDLLSFFDGNTVMLAPILTGTGIKTKILEAMALGVPVVTTPKGAEGLDVQPGVHLIVADDVAAMADICVELSAERHRLKSVAHAGHAYASSVHSEAIVRRAFLDVTTGSDIEVSEDYKRKARA